MTQLMDELENLERLYQQDIVALIEVNRAKKAASDAESSVWELAEELPSRSPGGLDVGDDPAVSEVIDVLPDTLNPVGPEAPGRPCLSVCAGPSRRYGVFRRHRKRQFRRTRVA